MKTILMFEVVGLNSPIFPLQSNSHLEKSLSSSTIFENPGNSRSPMEPFTFTAPENQQTDPPKWMVFSKFGISPLKKGTHHFLRCHFFGFFACTFFFWVGWGGNDDLVVTDMYWRPTCGVWLLLQFESWSLTENTKTPSLTTASLHLKIGKLPNGKLGRIPSINFQGNSVDGRIPKQPPDIL